jgi:rhomboid protease GluP
MFNMAAFYQLAPAVGRIYGTARMFVLYTLTGVLASLVSYTAGTRFSIGASGAVCGLIGAVLIYGKLRGDDFGNALYRQTLGWVIGIAVFGLLVPGIDNWGHGGGLLAGIGGGYLMGVRSRDTAFDTLIAAGCALAVIAVLILSPAPVIANRFGL